MNFFERLESLSVSQSILTGTWLHPILLVCHSIGMGVVVGIIFVLALRVLGFAPAIPLDVFRRLVGLGWAGFVLNLATGILMFMAYAHTLATNWTFDLKMLCIIAGGLSLRALAQGLRGVDPLLPGVVFDRRARILAAVTMLFWLGAIATGRLIAYTAPEGT